MFKNLESRATRGTETHSIDWHDVKNTYLRFVADKVNPQDRQTARLVRDWREGGRVDFYGGTGNECVKYLREGFTSPDLQLKPLTPAPRRKARKAWSENDGEFSYERFRDGADDFFLTRGPREKLAGISITVQMCFVWNVPHATIARYGAFVASLMTSLEAQGFDLEVNICTTNLSLFREKDGRGEIVNVRVKRAGELADVGGFTPLFSPCGYRHLLFLTYGMIAEREGLSLTGFVGLPAADGWGITQDGGEIVVTCNQTRDGSDPLAILTDKATAAGIL